MLRADARRRPGEGEKEPYFMSSIKRIVDAMDPERAMEEIAAVVKGLFGHVSEQARCSWPARASPGTHTRNACCGTRPRTRNR